MAKAPDPLFPDLPEDLTVLSDDDLAALLQEHEVAADLIDSNDAEFTKGIEPADEIAAYEQGVAQIEAIKEEQKARVVQQETYAARKAELAERRKTKVEEDEAEVVAEAEEITAEAAEDDDSSDEEEDGAKTDEVVAEEEVVVVAAAETQTATNNTPTVRLRRPPQPSPDRMPDGAPGAVLTAAAGVEGLRAGQTVDRMNLAKAYSKTADRWGRVVKHDGGQEQRILVASATFPYPDDRKLSAKDWEANSEKIAAVVPAGVPGVLGVPLPKALTASGGFCAPLEPIYSMPNFASLARPVRDSLPSFQAERGGVNVPTATYIADIETAITVIEESEDAQGGTFATKSCQDLACPAYTETAVTIISHCREYGNLNAIAWPEKIAHENDLTMAAHARTAETYLLDRIKALSINVTNGAETLGALIYLVDAITKAASGIRYRLRMDPDARFRAILPTWVQDELVLDNIQTIDGNRFKSKAELVSYLRSVGIEPTFHLDNVTGAVPFSAETASAIDGFPDTVQWALFAEGTFIHLDMGSLELGIVRDSTLNSTNDYQFFGESFENVARLGPAQAALWVTSDLCASGQFPPAGTARTCD